MVFFLLKKIDILHGFPLQTVNIVNAYDDPRFDQSVDDASCFTHKTILCMAIKNSLGKIIGVIQLINKFDSLVCGIFIDFLRFFFIYFQIPFNFCDNLSLSQTTEFYKE